MLLNGGELNGKRLLKQSTVEMMRTNVLSEQVLNSKSGVGQAQFSPAQGFGYDFAVVLDPAAAKRQVGRNSYWWWGIAGTWFWIDPTNDMLVIGMMQNVEGSRPDRGSPQVRPLSRKLVYAALTDPKK
jgi:CubicO group peptidase (beta-lactamase class C family)